ncbi:proton-conducting transporter membrane subunit, partial [uncultured Lamprocystis sp.]|uniref:proton-conducting transporter transmembrane domain-containing protein n=1 Tax=uncultured Lamprocystis sp. TaxID=543132 RepID=UPI0025F16703
MATSPTTVVDQLLAGLHLPDGFDAVAGVIRESLAHVTNSAIWTRYGQQSLEWLIGMNPVDRLFMLSALTLLLMLLLGRLRSAGVLAVLLYGAQFAALLSTDTLFGAPVAAEVRITVADQSLHWSYDALSWFFAMITIGAAFVTAWYAAGSWMRRYREAGQSARAFHVALALNCFGMLLLVGSADLLSLFLGWELVSWAGFLLMALVGGPGAQAALKYLAYAISGAMLILGAIALLYSSSGSFEYAAVTA